MATQVVELTGDEAALLRSLDRVIQKEREHERRLHQTAEAGDYAGRSIADALDLINKESEKSVKEAIRELNKLGPAGKVAADELQAQFRAEGKFGFRGVDEILADLQKVVPEAKAAANSAAAAFDAAGRDAADAFDLTFSPIVPTIHQRLSGAADKGLGAFRRFGQGAVGQLISVAGAYVGIQEGIQKVIELNRKVKETNEASFASLQSQQSGDKRLLQIATDQEDFDKLRGEADRLASTYGIERDQARQLVFSARSEGFENSLDFIASNQQLLDVDAQARVAGQVPTLFRGENLSAPQVINATLAAAKNSRLSFEEIGRALPSASEGASLTGSSAAEATGALAALASRFKSADTAADRLKSLALKFSIDQGSTAKIGKDGKESGITRESLAGLGLTAGVEKLSTFSDAQRRDFLGESQELNTAYKVYLEEIERIKAFTSDAQQAIDSTGTEDSPTAIARSILAKDERSQTLLREKRSEISLELARENRRATTEGRRQAGVQSELTAAETRGASKLSIAAAEGLSEGLSTFGYDEEAREIIGALTGDTLANLNRETSAAYGAGDEQAGALLLLSDKLRRGRKADPNAIIGQDAAAEYLRAVGGEDILPADVTDQARVQLTAAVAGAAGQSRGALGSLFVSDSAEAKRGTAASDIVEQVALEQLELLRRSADAAERNAAALERQNALAEQTLQASQQTAENTRNAPPDTGAEQRAAAAQADLAARGNAA